MTSWHYMMTPMPDRLSDVWALVALLVVIVIALVAAGGLGGLAVASFLVGVLARCVHDRRSRAP